MSAQSAWGRAFRWSLGNWRISILLFVPAAVLLDMIHQHPVAILAVSTLLIALASEILVGQIEFVTKSLGWTELFVGLVVVATVGNAAEHSTAVMMARKNQMDLALNVAVGSNTQIALFVAPLLVIVSQLTASPCRWCFIPWRSPP